MRTRSKEKGKGKKEKAWTLGLSAWSFPVSNTPFDYFSLRERFSSLRSPVSGLLTWCLVFGFLLGSCHSGTQKTTPASKSDESGEAKFVFPEEIHNFGSLKAGELVSFTFTFRNEGTKTLTITEVDSGCGCTQVTIPDKTIEPGQEGQIEVIYNSAGEIGKQLKTITITSNAETPKKQLMIRADVTNEIIEINS